MAIFATWTTQHLGTALPSVVIVPLIFTAGFIGGALWGIIPAILKIEYAINEVITTLMLNYLRAKFLTMLIVGPWKKKTGSDTKPRWWDKTRTLANMLALFFLKSVSFS